MTCIIWAVPQPLHIFYVWSGIWQNMGWSSIIYLAALAGVDQELHEAAMVDGAEQAEADIHNCFARLCLRWLYCLSGTQETL